MRSWTLVLLGGLAACGPIYPDPPPPPRQAPPPETLAAAPSWADDGAGAGAGQPAQELPRPRAQPRPRPRAPEGPAAQPDDPYAAQPDDPYAARPYDEPPLAEPTRRPAPPPPVAAPPPPPAAAPPPPPPAAPAPPAPAAPAAPPVPYGPPPRPGTAPAPIVPAAPVLDPADTAAEPAARLSRDAQALLDWHNRHRAKHCAAPLRWSPQLAEVAAAWARSLRDQGCKFGHSGGRYGENLAAGTAGTLDGKAVTDMWYDEVRLYKFPDGGFSMQTGHFTQVVWRQSTQLGCAVTTCRGMDIWVCEYDPPGNVQGQFRQNVLPVGCTAKP